MGKIDFRLILIIVLFVLIVVLIVLTVWGHIGDFRVSEADFPAAENPREVQYNINFINKIYTVRDTLHESIYHYYSDYYDRIPNIQDELEFYDFIKQSHEDDDTIDRIVASIDQLAEDNDFTRAQAIELAMRFVQNIPYDVTKASQILNYPQNEDEVRLDLLPRHPYVTLYYNRGVCSDKTVLAAAIAEKMGYGTGIFSFLPEDLGTNAGHVGLGLKCPPQYSVLNTGYCYVETTAPVKIGMTNIYLTPDVQAIPIYSLQEDIETIKLDFTLAEFGELEDGDSYYGIVRTYSLESILQELDDTIDEQNSIIGRKRQRLNQLNLTLQTMANQGVIQQYIDEYDAIYTEYENLSEEFNELVDDYNRNVERYNRKLKELEY